MDSAIKTEQPAKKPIEASSKSSLWREIYKNKALYLFISPFYILFIIFGLFPIIFSLYLSFQKWDGIGQMEFVGLKQFKYLLSDNLFWQSVGNTFIIWFISTLPMLFGALIIAFLLNAPFVKYKGFYRSAYFITNVTSIVAVTIIFKSFFGNQYGLFNYILTTIGAEPVKWLDSSILVKVVIASMVVWRWTGYNAIIYLAGLQAIPNDLYEAAKIDGANTAQQFFHITIPLLRPIILFTVLMTTIGSMQLFTEPQVLLGNSGGVGGAGLTITLYMYKQGFIDNQFGYASVVSWALFVIIGLFSLLNWKIVTKAGAK
ncbi:carbohydrate ABC transporter permease [Lederbergia citrea]|uniref:Sugar ABC transporter permease n=1 Tax=Lederbergia citrea TaxID=2833581 RepID=A0A942Z349_9BACI|nr:sugar ABC transporter permease [Lederbergia citrea]MBS4178259.1 sugar ABC transporter permease [Lederbergia citrea]MBS4204935.1 sugar ABC transporter permease [Lederbergia citrea]MBS4223213.1 sugar ABC transporter permease [Lederbergia citrea]